MSCRPLSGWKRCLPLKFCGLATFVLVECQVWSDLHRIVSYKVSFYFFGGGGFRRCIPLDECDFGLRIIGYTFLPAAEGKQVLHP